MNTLLPFIVAGVTTGSVYGLAGVGLVLTYKTSGIFNFAHGALATVAAYVFYFLYVQHGVPWPAAGIACLVVLGPGLGAGFEAFARYVARAPLVWQVVGTLGVLLIVEAVCDILYGPDSRPYPHFLPTSTFRVLGASVTWESLIIVAVSVVLTGGLYAFFRIGRAGKAMRAVVDDPSLLALAGTNPAAVRRFAWMIGTTFAVLSGLLLAPSISLQASTLTLLVVQAFGAAAIGRFTNLPMTWVGGLVIGVGSSIATKYLSANSILGGIPASLPFIVLFGILVLSPRGQIARAETSLPRRAVPWQAPGRVQVLGGIVVIVVLACLPELVGFHLVLWTSGLCSVILFMSLGLLVRLSGQVSLCQAGFAAVGAVAFSRLTVDAHLPWLLALLLAGLIVVPIGVLVAIPAIRLPGIYLALATFGFGLLLEDMFYQTSLMFGSNIAGIEVPMPHLSWLDVDSDTGFYFVVLAITTVIALALLLLDRSRLGRLLRGMADAPTALMTSGTSVFVTRTLVFCLSAYIAGIAGALSGSVLTFVSGVNYDPITSLTDVVLLMICVGGVPWYALLAGFSLTVIPGYISSTSTSYYLQIIFGAAAIMAALGLQAGVPEVVRRAVDRIGGRRTPASARASAGTPNEERARVSPRGLELRGVEVAFGGLVAVSDLSLSAPPGQITGLIGPNGAGKTTTFNACCGLNRTSRGEVLLGGSDVSRLGPAARARRGLGRSFQQPALYDSLSVLENVELGKEAGLAGSSLSRHLYGGRGQRAAVSRAAWEAVEMCGLDDLAGDLAGALSTGQRRLVELARCLAGDYGMLLLDEPSAGLDRAETRQFGQILRGVVASRGIGILLVEHDMALVMEVCADIFVLDFGTLIFRGTPDEVQQSELVRAAYLGSEAPPADTRRQAADPAGPQ
jgi:ABC-type branched-subunit amino acid transport system ATPase component/branched-subunit amino acid ABC-type transport system permease component